MVNSDRTALKERFLNLFHRYSENETYALECWKELEQQYESASRHYHNLEHLAHMFTELEAVKTQVKQPETLDFAIFYHDIIYKITSSENEHQSALLFEKRMANTTFPYTQEVKDLIEATREHTFSEDPDINILLDLDLSILGKSPEEYQNYCANIRKEYSLYPDFMYRNGRIKVLKRFLALDAIYKTAFFKSAYEVQAQINLNFELQLLTQGR